MSSFDKVDLRDVREVRITGAPTGGVYLGDLAFSDVRVGKAQLDEVPEVSLQGLPFPRATVPASPP